LVAKCELTAAAAVFVLLEFAERQTAEKAQAEDELIPKLWLAGLDDLRSR
jgi:hypothetical protein